MPLSSPRLYETLNRLLGPAGITVAPLVVSLEDDAFIVEGLPVGPMILSLPLWEVEEWQEGFGGWRICGGNTVRFVRQRLSHDRLYEIVGEVLTLADILDDIRTTEVRSLIENALGDEGFYFQSFADQLAEQVVLGLSKVGFGTTQQFRNRSQSNFRSFLTKWLNSFPMTNGHNTLEDRSLLQFIQDQVRVGYPEEGLPAGIDSFFRDPMVKWLHSQPAHFNHWNQGPFRACAACTGKTKAGEWITMIPNQVTREVPGIGTQLQDPPVPLRIAAQCPIGISAKRTLREGNALRTAWKLSNPVPITQGMRNGYEHHLGKDLTDKVTEVTVAIIGIEGVNLYRHLSGGDEFLNLDDIIKTERGVNRLRTEWRREWHFPAAEWPAQMGQFLEGGRMKAGYEVQPELGYKATVSAKSHMSCHLYGADMTVVGPIGRDQNVISKVLVNGTLKAMAKRSRCQVRGIDANGKVYDIDLCISGHSLKEKKSTSIGLSAVAARAGITYWDDFMNPVHPERQPYTPTQDRDTWANAYPDLVQAVHNRLTAAGEDPSGKIDLYVREADPSDPSLWTNWVFIGRGAVGFARASVLWENEQSGSKVRSQGAVPYSAFLRFLANRKLDVSDDTKGYLNQMIGLWNQLTPEEIAETEYA